MGKKLKNSICVFDLDNTLYDFIDFFGPAFRGMVSAVSKTTGVDKELLIESAKEVISDRGFTEYAFLIREMRIFSDYSIEQVGEIERVASGAFARVRNKRLKTYPDTEGTIKQLFDGGVKIAAVTNAPLYQAYRRLESLKLIKYFSLIVAVDNTVVPEYVKLKGNPEPWSKKDDLKTITFSRSLGKPNSHSYQVVIDETSDISEYWVVGDNVGRDLAPAAPLGFKTIWAEYGCNVDDKNYETVLQLTPTAIKKHEVAKSEYQPDYIISGAKELLSIIPHQEQFDMFS